MAQVHCIKHPKYTVDKKPDLTCKVCCQLFLEKIISDGENAKKVDEANQKIYDHVVFGKKEENK